MSTYLIHHRIDTLLRLEESFEFDGFSFRPWSTDWSAGPQEGWIATRTMEAASVEDAFRDFSETFRRLVDRIAIIGQCYTTADLESFLVTKPGDDRFFVRYTNKRGPVPLHFNKEEIESLAALEKYEETGDTFRYLREAINAASFYTMLVMLVSALEAMAGTTDERGKRVIDHEFMADRILKDQELHDRLFKHGEGIRNQILHGGFVDEQMHGTTNYNEIVYNKIVDYFIEQYGSKINKTARARPRQVLGHYNVWRGWCRWTDKETKLSLQLFHEKFEADGPDYYETIDWVSDY